MIFKSQINSKTVRTIVIPDNQDISIQLPASYAGKRIEVIAFEIDEEIVSKNTDEVLTHYASQSSLEKDWLTDEENNAW